jgi:plastocyanin
MRRALLLGAGLALVAAAPAGAATVEITADNTPLAPVWKTPLISIQPGDTVVWSWPAGEPRHNVASRGTNWSYLSTADATRGEFTFPATGNYAFICQFHEASMSGVITVGNAPPPPPPPLSEQPFTNDASFDPATLETGGLDTTRPKLRNVALDWSGRRLKLRFRVSERSEVTVRLVRAGKRVRTKRVSARSRGSVTLRGLRPGRYRVQLRARDLAGNASGARVAHVTVG